MSYQLTARVAITIEANRAAVWRALCDPGMLRQRVFATSVDYPEFSNWLEREPTFEWRDGGTITWGSDPRKGIQHGTILKIEPDKALHFNHPFPGSSYDGS